jgi:6-pyruvoyltetrahydropterin/6-carboxytetrahydropterin synthase
MEKVVVDSDLRYIDSKGNLLRTRSEFSVSKMLSFLGQDYKYDVRVKLPNGKPLKIDFQVGSKRYIEVVDSEADAAKFKQIREQLPDLDIIAVGHSKYASKINEMDSLFFYDSADHMQTGSIFIEDQSLAFDYAHILPLVEKCSMLHGHTSTVMVEIIGSMKNNLVIDFGEARRIIKETLNTIDHKFFINKKYLQREDDWRGDCGKSVVRDNQAACAQDASKCPGPRGLHLRRRQQGCPHHCWSKERGLDGR